MNFITLRMCAHQCEADVNIFAFRNRLRQLSVMAASTQRLQRVGTERVHPMRACLKLKQFTVHEQKGAPNLSFFRA
eukprot:3230763-Amphidinium_carterae.1